ncbi:MAG: Ig-like domain-containing protein [Proteobacteria bacterium]|jgi:hypothetical protein|nr:Ig-like domain-containing protein [Pseudomonadota bacterium]
MKLNKMKSILMIALSLAFYHCGSDGTNTIPFGNTGSLSGFRVTSSTPAHNQFYVSQDTTVITVRMSEAVNQTTIPNQIQVIKTAGGQEQNVTSSYNISVNGDIITLQSTSGLSHNADYEIRLYPGLAAVSGTTLLQGESFQYFFIDFSTGNGGTQGQGVAGPPSVVNITRADMGGCFGALIQFNESLGYQPQVTIRYTQDVFSGPIELPVFAQPAQYNTMTHWRIDACINYIPMTNITVKVLDYADLEGNHGSPACRKFHTTNGTSSSDC